MRRTEVRPTLRRRAISDLLSMPTMFSVRQSQGCGTGGGIPTRSSTIAEDQPTALCFVLSSRMIDYSSILPVICVMLSSQWKEALLGALNRERSPAHLAPVGYGKRFIRR
jgi:hypothetical protein